jgi:hypothetical protein
MSERAKVEGWSLATCMMCRMPFGQEASWVTMCPFCFKEDKKYAILKGDLAFAFVQQELNKKMTAENNAPPPSDQRDSLEANVLRRRVAALETELAQSRRQNQDLQREVVRLKAAKAQSSGVSQSPDLPLLRKMLVLCHPDKHKDSPTATEVTQWINGQISKVRP